jgi:hypothetical protein
MYLFKVATSLSRTILWRSAPNSVSSMIIRSGSRSSDVPTNSDSDGLTMKVCISLLLGPVLYCRASRKYRCSSRTS